MWLVKCSYSGDLKVVLTTVPTASKLLIKFSINVLTRFNLGLVRVQMYVWMELTQLPLKSF